MLTRAERAMLLCCLAALQSVVRGQPRNEAAFLLPDTIHLSVTVTDTNDRPLAGVSVNHTGLIGPVQQTDSEGRIEVGTRAPALVFRKPGFSGKYYRVARDAAVRIKLEPTSRSLGACTSTSNCASLTELLSTFCFPKVLGIRVGPQQNDVDYGQRHFLIRSPGSIKGIQHAAGPLWGSGLPWDQDVWSAVEYSEAGYRDMDGFTVIDARGRTGNGEYWRVLGHAFETASYRRMTVRDSRVLDRVLDGVCLKRQPGL